MLQVYRLRRDQLNAACVLDGGRDKRSVVTLHACVVSGGGDWVAEGHVATMSDGT